MFTGDEYKFTVHEHMFKGGEHMFEVHKHKIGDLAICFTGISSNIIIAELKK